MSRNYSKETLIGEKEKFSNCINVFFFLFFSISVLLGWDRMESIGTDLVNKERGWNPVKIMGMYKDHFVAFSSKKKSKKSSKIIKAPFHDHDHVSCPSPSTNPPKGVEKKKKKKKKRNCYVKT